VAEQPVERFGRFDLWKKIGQGGMAEVFLSTDRDGGIAGEFVVKRMHRELESKREAVELFTTEADVTLLLKHPGIVEVLESGEIDGRYYMAMELIRGWTLEELGDILFAKDQALEPDPAVHIIMRVLETLRYIHAATSKTGRPLGLVHRDVTPSNVYVTYEGDVKIGDFGVAKLAAVEGWTMAGSLKGKLGYLAPEQVAGKPPDQSIDRYAAAIMLYELLTGKACFEGENELDVMLHIRDAKYAKPRKLRPSVPRALQRIVCKALRKWPSWRFKTADAFLAALADYRDRYGERVIADDLTALMMHHGLKRPT
jgi:serine/threonine-protein kinase